MGNVYGLCERKRKNTRKKIDRSSVNMVLVAIVGELGIGKTLTLTYLAWNNWFYEKRKICSNYTLYGIPFTPIKTIEDLKAMIPAETPTLDELLNIQEVFFAGDELWRWIDARCSVMEVSERERKKIKNKLITDILAASRKAFVTIAYTTQTIGQIDKRIRQVTDFLVYPLIKGNFICQACFFVGPNPSAHSIDKDIRFYCEPFYAMFNTYERIKPLEEGYRSEEVFIPIEKNPAWIKYLKDRGLDESEIMKECIKMGELIKKG